MAARMTITGRVQGVGYRWWTVGEAGRLGLAGWVRNRADGTVEIHAEGPAEALQALAAACRRGPPTAGVTDVAVREAPDEGHQGFAQRPTA